MARKSIESNQMNVGFYIGRMSYIAHFGPLIDYFQKKGAKISLYCDHRTKQKDYGYKAYQYPYPEKIRKALNVDEIQIFHTTEEFIGIVLEDQMQVVFFFAIDAIAQEAKAILGERAKNIIFAHLQTGADIIGARNLASADIVFVLTENWKIWWKKWLSEYQLISRAEQDDVFEQIDRKAVVSGLPHVDQMVTYSRKSICRKYDLPMDKKIILYLPFPWRVPFCVWSHVNYKPQNKFMKLTRLLRHGCWGQGKEIFNSDMANDLDVVKSIREFADRNNAFFLVKDRLKNKLPSYLKKLSDKIVYDESYYPYTIDELMFVSDVCVHFYSDTVKECVISNVPSICLGPQRLEDWPCYFAMFFIKELSPNPMNYFNYDGLVFNESVESFIEKFPNQTFDNYAFKAENKDKFVQKYLGYSDFNSSKRIYDHLNNRLTVLKQTEAENIAHDS